MFKNYREESRNKGWGTDSEGNLTADQLQLGAVLRIADATEAMAKRHTELIRERDNFERMYRDASRRAEHYRRSNAGLRGVITRLKNKK